MTPPSYASILARTSRVLWAVTLLTLPVTSFRYFPAGEGTYVRPLAFFPLALLLLVLCIQLLRRETTFPHAGALTPLTALLLVALGTSLLGILLSPVPLRDQVVTGRILRAWITLLMAPAFSSGRSG